jgi:hypothetical protein
MNQQWIFGIGWWCLLLHCTTSVNAQSPTTADSLPPKPTVIQEVKDYLRPFFVSSKKLSVEELREQAQPSFGLYFYPLSLSAANVTLAGELKLGFRTSVRAVGSFGSAEISQYYRVKNMTNGYLEGQFRYYPLRYAMKSIYVMGFGYAKAMTYKIDLDLVRNDYYSFNRSELEREFGFERGSWIRQPDLNGTALAVGFGLAVGFQVKLCPRVVLDVYGGAAHQTPFHSGNAYRFLNGSHPIRNGFWDNYVSGIKEHIGFSLGVLFFR